MTALSSPIRSPSPKASGLRPDAVRFMRLRSVALFQIGGIRQARCRAPVDAIEQTALRGLRLAGRAFAHLRAIAQACRPVPSPSFPDAAFMVQPGPGRVVVLVSCVNPLPVHCSSLLWRPQDTTAESARANRLWPETDNAKRG